MAEKNKHNKWLEILDFQPKLLWRTPTKTHRERRRRRQQEAARKAQRTSLSTAKASSSTQNHENVQRQRQNTTITLQMEPMKSGNTEWRRFKKRWGYQATLTVYSKIILFDAAIGSNNYTICTMQVKNIFTTD